MPKFILIDSNIAGDGGHYLEYAEQILEVAAERGFECHLAANRAFHGRRKRGARYTPHAIFSHDMWGRNLSRLRDRGNEFTAEDRRYLRDYYSLAGLLWNAANEVHTTRHYAQHTTIPGPLARRLLQVHDARRKVESLLSVAEEPELSGSESEDRALRYRRFRQALRDAGREAADRSPESPLLAAMLRQSRASDSYGAAIAGLLKTLKVKADDHVFIPTLSLAEARSIRDLMRRDDRARGPRWSLLFRRNVYDGYSSMWPSQDWAVHEARNLFASFLPMTPSVRVNFFTDTDLLTNEYNRLGSVPFHTTAIPVRIAPPPEPQQRADLPFTVLVLGLERSISSLCSFVELMEGLAPADLDRIHFLAPANAFDSPGGSGDERDIIRSAQARLRPYRPDALTISGSAEQLNEMAGYVDACLAFDSGFAAGPIARSGSSLKGVPLIAPARLHDLLGRRSNSRLLEYEPGPDAVGQIVGILRRQLSQPRKAIAEDNRLVVGYLGDARAEKGFHLLPEIMDSLSASQSRGQGFHLDTQVFHPNPEGDTRMLRAMERVRRMPADRATIHEGALDSAEYQAIIGRSDIIFNVYARHNYISRSSGVFVEALANRKPVLTTAATWMSALMDEWSDDYHDEALASSRLLGERRFSVVRDWWEFIGEGRLSGKPHEPLTLPRGLSACYREAIPARASHLRVQVCIGGRNPDAPLNLIVAWQDAGKMTQRELSRQFNRLTPGVVSLVFPVPAGTKHVWIGISLGGSSDSVPIEWARMTWHATGEPVAELPGGIAISDGDDATLVSQAVNALQALRKAYRAYVHSCAWVFERWTRNQTAASLFDDLLKSAPSASASSSRFIGKEW